MKKPDIVNKTKTTRLLRAAFVGYVALQTSTTFAASCCGGGAGTSVILPKFNELMIEANSAYEQFDGNWNPNGQYVDEIDGQDLNELTTTLSIAKRLHDQWQFSVNLPYTRHDNQYPGETGSSSGLGDTSMSLWYEAFENVTCIYRIAGWESLKPSIYLGGQLTVPTGKSRYSDRVERSEEITGRGFYRFDSQVMIEKTIYPWSLSVTWMYGKYLERPVNQEYGRDIEPYDKQLGDRHSISSSLGYTWFAKDMSMVTLSGSYTDLSEGASTIDGDRNEDDAFQKISSGLNLTYTSPRRDWFAKLGYSQADRGIRTPRSSTMSLGVGYVL